MKYTLTVADALMIPQDIAATEPDHIAELEKIAEYALELPTLNTTSLQEYDNYRLDYRMTIRIVSDGQSRE
ncbi:hypothetical protein [Rubinisphaera sp.]|uniref:hypothetical protein n=1 Tax=Rubinisphaera sp. TaxID=2024857 RepID=UPI000C10E0D9|nr:hypothetical protein [Rubinisphaera sp.]MBV09473.1 hypothetical protein [Rubinisphaera sp.]